MSTPYIGEIRAVGFNFPPVGWVPCNGQLLAISEYDVLFNLIGTTYGGDGQTTFGAPNLNSRIAPGAMAPGPGLSNYVLGQVGGQESVTLTNAQMPTHLHGFSSPISATTSGTATNNPAGNLPGSGSSGQPYIDSTTTGVALASNTVAGNTAAAGGNQPHENIQPVLAMNFIICVEGIYPSQP